MLEEFADPAFVTARPARPADALARLAAGAAHELNNPLSVMVGYLSLIASGQTPQSRVPEQLQRVADETRHCRVVLQGLTELAESTLADPELVDLRALLVDAQAALGEPAPLIASIVGEAPTRLLGQARGLANFISHGLKNAAEASARSIMMKLTQTPGLTRLELTDDGRGMSEQVLNRAREPFYSTDPARLGLGLAICDAVAWAHGGSLVLSSREGRGTTLSLILPSEPAEEAAP
jgi:two-component system, NtrC family, sensor kinase